MPTLPRTPRSLLVLASLALFACGTSRTEPPTGEPEPPPPADPIETRAPAQDETVVEVEETRIDDRALQAAATAAEHAPVGRDTCETAVNGIIAMMEAAESESRDGQRLPRPHRADFVAACRRLPANAQQCFVPTYAMAHEEECNRVLTSLPPGQLDAVQAAMETQPNE